MKIDSQISAVVTGGASGLGEATVRDFAAGGAKVAIFDMNATKGEKLAQELGANAVINIASNYKNVEMLSDTEYECHDGAMMTGVALKGDFVKIAD